MYAAALVEYNLSASASFWSYVNPGIRPPPKLHPFTPRNPFTLFHLTHPGSCFPGQHGQHTLGSRCQVSGSRRQRSSPLLQDTDCPHPGTGSGRWAPATMTTHRKNSDTILFVTNLHVQGVRGRGVAGDGAAHVGRGGAGEGGVAGALRVNVVRRRFPLCTTGGEEVSELSFVSSWIQFWPCCGTYVNT